MILVGLGANLPSAAFGAPVDTLSAAIDALSALPDISIRRRSRFYRSAPQPPSDQPWFVNAVVELGTRLEPGLLMARLHEVEEAFGRVRSVPNAARIIDLDLLDYQGRISGSDEWPLLPHPRMTDRLFVLLPICDIAPEWRHPVNRTTAFDLARTLLDGQEIEPIE